MSRASSRSSSVVVPMASNASLTKLCLLLNKEGHKVLSGKSAFTLTTEVLTQLNSDCRRHSFLESETAVPGNQPGERSFLPLTNRLRAQQEASKAREEWSDSVQFIKDFMLSTPSLKLIHYCRTLSSPVSLHRFGNLTCLHLQKVPIHMVEGLHKLRGTLVSITVYRSVDRIKDLLEFCGGDMTSPTAWPKLANVSFMFNSISTLDDSLRLLPSLESLDVSHNSLESCNNFLEYLTDVKRVTLAYNFLTKVPSFSVTARVSVVCLILRRNNLDSLTGLELLTSLQELDLGENCISDHDLLQPLLSLNKLRQLHLDGNPVFYHKLHRILTTAHLSPKVVYIEFELDSKKLTDYEQLKAAAHRPHNSLWYSVNGVGERAQARENSFRGLSPSSGIGTGNESAGTVTLYKTKKKSKRRKLKPRQTEILDFENSGTASSGCEVTPGTSPHPQAPDLMSNTRRDEAVRTKDKVEDLKKNYGSDWLQAANEIGLFNKKSATLTPESSDVESDNGTTAKFIIGSKSSNSSGARCEAAGRNSGDSKFESEGQFRKGGFPTDDDLYLTNTIINDNNNPIMAAIAKLAAGQSPVCSVNENKSVVNMAVPTSYNFRIEINSAFKKSSRLENGRVGSSSENLEALGSTAEIKGSSMQSDTHRGDNIRDELTGDVSNIESTLNSGMSAVTGREMLASTCERPSSPIHVVSKSSGVGHNSLSHSQEIDRADLDSATVKSPVLVGEDELIESVFATLPTQGREIILVTVTASFLVEKDVRGQVTEKLDLNSLAHLDWKKVTKSLDGNSDEHRVIRKVESSSPEERKVESSSPEERKDMWNSEGGDKGEVKSNDELMQLDLKFDYLRKDRQNRRYLLDLADGQVLISYLQPFLDSRDFKEKAKSSVTMQCLKCNRTFLKGELVQLRKEIPHSGSSKDLQSLQQIMSTSTLICPKCGSSIIIELDSSSTVVRSTGSAASTPVGSYTSVGGYMEQIKKPGALAKRRSLDHSRVPAGSLVKERHSSAFMSPSKTLVSDENSMSEVEELDCVEDHFSAKNMREVQSFSPAVEMTTSLVGDSSSRGKRMAIRRNLSVDSLLRNSNFSASRAVGGGNNKQDNVQNRSVVDDRQLLDNDWNDSGVGDASEPTKPVNIQERVAKLHDQESRGQDNDNVQLGSRRISVHKNLAAMEDIVNSLVSEGQSLENQDRVSASSFNKNKSVSLSTFMKSSLSRNGRRASVNSVDANEFNSSLRRSESNSSITVLPAPSSDAETLTTVSTLGSSVQSEFSPRISADIGTSIANSEKGIPTIVSPLSSNICSSMVSSVYEMSVNNPDSEVNYVFQPHAIIGDEKNGSGGLLQQPTGDPAYQLVSTSVSTEDLTSIYDHPRVPSSSTRQRVPSMTKPSLLHEQLEANLTDPSTVSTFSPTLDLHPASQNVQSSANHVHLHLKNVEPENSSVHKSSVTASEDDSKSVTSDEDNDELSSAQFAFHHLNHRLTLYMMMSLFGTDEEFVCKLQAQVVQYIVEKPYEGILVMSSGRFYILKVTSEDHSQTPDHWLQCVDIQPIPELRYIDVGLGAQSLRLEFNTDCSSFTFITRNRDKTTQFVEVLHTNLARYAVSQGITSHVVVTDDVDEVTLSNLDRDVTSKVTSNQKLLHYCLGFIERGKQKLFPVSFVISTSDVCLVSTNHQWPQPRLQATISEETVGKQFTVLERQKVSNVASVEVCESSMKKLRLVLFSELHGGSSCWNMTFTCRQSTIDFVNALSEPWAKEFGVEMDVVYAELSF